MPQDRPTEGFVTHASLGCIGGGLVGGIGSVPILMALNHWFGVELDGLLPLSLGILGALFGLIAAPLFLHRSFDD